MAPTPGEGEPPLTAPKVEGTDEMNEGFRPNVGGSVKILDKFFGCCSEVEIDGGSLASGASERLCREEVG